ncbi:MAG: hypothetical protein GF330_02750 [Candidatus Eisenbacteria bacterium]|nr:hypothetical protein [Candidatus Eisenbacteria bacterium]
MPAREDYFVDLKGTSRDLKPTYHFMMKCLLYSRMETGLVSNKDYYDEDVNVYIAHLLNSFIKPDYIERAKGYLSKYDTEVFGRLADSRDARLKYTLYKTNADFLLVSLGIFDNPAAGDPQGGGKLVSPERRLFQPTEEAYVGRGKTYYRFAYTYSQQIHNPRAAITEVLEKLSVGFEKYLRILAHMRGEYLNLLDRLSGGDIYHLQRTVSEADRNEDLHAKQDRFLDLYSEWKRSGDPEVRAEIETLASDIRALDPSFTFELPREP